jgi:hypothetical protein
LIPLLVGGPEFGQELETVRAEAGRSVGRLASGASALPGANVESGAFPERCGGVRDGIGDE